MSEKIYQYANRINDEGKKSFPIVATCLGFEMMIHLMSNKKLPLKSAVNPNNSLPVVLNENFKTSSLSKIFTSEDKMVFSKPIFYFHH